MAVCRLCRVAEKWIGPSGVAMGGSSVASGDVAGDVAGDVDADDADEGGAGAGAPGTGQPTANTKPLSIDD